MVPYVAPGLDLTIKWWASLCLDHVVWPLGAQSFRIFPRFVASISTRKRAASIITGRPTSSRLRWSAAACTTPARIATRPSPVIRSRSGPIANGPKKRYSVAPAVRS